ncbi:G-protein coupled receptor 4-like [Erpetoichthys calabaricus]|uniref:G-protein coupled receptor 4-like n=1 Tax=Erpetoichthys calabaricus TaxID=27687 RepID=UPI00109EE6C5|nr:G-protein coupled receptor 4-like [Erpetoichthys calabaricus]
MNATNDTSDICDGIDFSSDQVFLPVLYGFIFCLGLPTNCLALYGLGSYIKCDKALPIFVVNLLVSDLLHLLPMPLWIDYYHNGHNWRFGLNACTITSILFWICMWNSVFFSCCISVERYLAIVRPLWFQSNRLKGVYILCACIWLCVSIMTILAFRIGFSGSTTGLCMESYPTRRNFAQFRCAIMVFTFFFPLVLLLLCSTRASQKMKHIGFLSEDKKKRMKQLLSFVVFAFVLVFGPYHLLSLVKFILILHGNVCQNEATIFIFYQVGKGILSLNTLLDPVFYIFLRRDVKKNLEIFRLFKTDKQSVETKTGSESIRFLSS